MKSHYKHTEAASFLSNHALPSEAEIDAMSPADLAKFLADNGVDVPKLNAEIPKLQAQLTGKMSLARARQARLSKAELAVPVDLSVFTEKQMMDGLIAKYGRVEDIPLAARNLKSFDREELESLYTDLVIRASKGTSSGNA